MSAAALALVLVAALLHALWNVVAKKAAGDSRFVLLVAVFIVVVWAPVGAWVGWDAVPRWGGAEWALIVVSGITHLVYFNVLLRGYAASDLTMAACRVQWKHALVIATISPLAYVLVLYAVQMAPLSHVAPAREVSMLFAALLGGKLLGEGDRGLRIVGAVCIALGVAGLALG